MDTANGTPASAGAPSPAPPASAGDDRDDDDHQHDDDDAAGHDHHDHHHGGDGGGGGEDGDGGEGGDGGDGEDGTDRARAAQALKAAGMGPSSTDARFAKMGFAKLLGNHGLEYYVRQYEVILGRKKGAVDVVLGEASVLSRQHARIRYNFAAHRWELVVEGKNGVTVNGTLVTPQTGPYALSSADFLQAGDNHFYFLLPRGSAPRARKPPAPGLVRPSVSGVSAPSGSVFGGGGGGEGAGVVLQPPQQQQQQPLMPPQQQQLMLQQQAQHGSSSMLLPPQQPPQQHLGLTSPSLLPPGGAAGLAGAGGGAGPMATD